MVSDFTGYPMGCGGCGERGLDCSIAISISISMLRGRGLYIRLTNHSTSYAPVFPGVHESGAEEADLKPADKSHMDRLFS